jgi:hypothetical protein
MSVRRPVGVAVVAIFMVVSAATVAVQLAVDTTFGTRVQTLTDIHDWTPAFFVVLIGVGLLAAGGLWLGYRWAWALAMVVVGISLVVSLYLYWLGDPPYPRMAIDVVIAFYLNQGDVRDFFERRGRAVEAEAPGSP